MKEAAQTQNIRVIKVANGFVIVGPTSYIADSETAAKEHVNKCFDDIIELFNKPKEATNEEPTPASNN